MRISGRKEINDVLQDLINEGWEIISKNRHIKVKSPGGSLMAISSTPSCSYAHKNIRRQADKIIKREKTNTKDV